MNICKSCSGLGLSGGCPSCGTYNYDNKVEESEIHQIGFKIPTYYKKNPWDSSKLKLGKSDHCNAILEVVNQLVIQVSQGRKIASSYAIMLPYGYGKKTAMFTIVQKYLQHGYTVAPVIDVASLAIMENNFKSNEKEATERWREMIAADLVCVYGVDFSARYYTMKLFLNLCSIRALQDKPTLLFAENSLDQLRSSYVVDNLSEENNLADVGCKLSHPYILDGVTGARSVEHV